MTIKISPDIATGFGSGDLYPILKEICDVGNALITLGNELKADYNLHRVKVGAHRRPDATNAIAADAATNAATALTLANDIKAKYNAHIADTIPHFVADTTNTEANDNASDESTTYVLLNSLKDEFNAHLEDTGHAQDDTVNEVTAEDADDEESSVLLANAIATAYAAHLAQVATVLNADTTNVVAATDASTDLTY